MNGLGLKDIIFVPSVQHTGTWFVIDFLKNFIPNSRELTFLLEDNIKDGQADINHIHKYEHKLTDPTIAHIHLPIEAPVNPETQFERRWYSNLGKMRSVSIQTILTICAFFKTVIPIRNPVAAILTREARHPQLRHFYIVDGFIALATEFSKHPNIKFLPIDMTDDPGIRRKLLLDVLIHCEIDPEPHGSLLDEMSINWEPKNITPGNKFKELYDVGDWDQLKFLLGPKWAEIEYFKNMASIIFPFLESLGYTREAIKP